MTHIERLVKRETPEIAENPCIFRLLPQETVKTLLV